MYDLIHLHISMRERREKKKKATKKGCRLFTHKDGEST